MKQAHSLSLDVTAQRFFFLLLFSTSLHHSNTFGCIFWYLSCPLMFNGPHVTLNEFRDHTHDDAFGCRFTAPRHQFNESYNGLLYSEPSVV